MIEKYPPAWFDYGSHETMRGSWYLCGIVRWDCRWRFGRRLISETRSIFSPSSLHSDSTIAQFVWFSFLNWTNASKTCTACIWVLPVLVACETLLTKNCQRDGLNDDRQRDGLNEIKRLYSDKGWHWMRRVENNTISIPFCENNSRMKRWNGMGWPIFKINSVSSYIVWDWDGTGWTRFWIKYLIYYFNIIHLHYCKA